MTEHTLIVVALAHTTEYTDPTSLTEAVTLFGRLFLRLINRLWPFCCERKALYHG
jgi:hypothetical protein